MESAMRSILSPPLTAASTALAACIPAPQDAQVRSDPVAGTAHAAATSAAQAPMPEPVCAAANPDPATMGDAAALGRRTLSTAFVRLGPDEHLLVDLCDGQTLDLRNVTMGEAEFCGVMMTDGVSGKRRCHGYADVIAARPRGIVTEAAPMDVGSPHRASRMGQH